MIGNLLQIMHIIGEGILQLFVQNWFGEAKKKALEQWDLRPFKMFINRILRTVKLPTYLPSNLRSLKDLP